MTFKKFLHLFFSKAFLQKFIAYFLLIAFFYIFSDFAGIFFLTFVFSYLFFAFGNFLKAKYDLMLKRICNNENRKKFLKNFLSLNIIIILEYLIFITVLFFAIYDIVPRLIRELSEIPKHIPILADQINQVTSKLNEIRSFNSQISGNLEQMFSSQNYAIAIQIYENLKKAGGIILQIFMALILSYVFISDRKKLGKYLEGIKKSNFRFLYDEYYIILEKISRSFGLVFKAQAIIATANSLLTIVGLFTIGLFFPHPFPYILTLGIFVFLLGFIPVLGTFISSVPLIIIAYSMVGGLNAVISVILLVAIVHAIEAYYLNPKIVSSFMEVPVSLTFIILLVSEHFMGFAGLLIGISIFYLGMELINDIDKIITKTKVKINAEHEIIDETKEHIEKDIRISRKMK
ncbi:MAG: AI-2E family transporter [Candidatus Gracilibacteria bacterium]|nr:AI-2E family transporter [Candidatus Gracilibacteria bacterium]